MNDQKNLFLAIAISIAIIVFFQFLFPTSITEPIQNAENEVLAPATSIDDPKTNVIEIIKPKEDILAVNKRVNIQTPSLTGSINLQGAILDDLTLSENDWIVAYNNNVIVGARRWNGKYTDIPVMGYDGTDATLGYCEAGDIPTFKIFIDKYRKRDIIKRK